MGFQQDEGCDIRFTHFQTYLKNSVTISFTLWSVLDSHTRFSKERLSSKCFHDADPFHMRPSDHGLLHGRLHQKERGHVVCRLPRYHQSHAHQGGSVDEGDGAPGSGAAAGGAAAPEDKDESSEESAPHSPAPAPAPNPPAPPTPRKDNVK